MISFKFQGVDYEVSDEAPKMDKIIFPDGRVYDVNWLTFETKPALPYGFLFLNKLSGDLSPDKIIEVAKSLDASVAKTSKLVVN